MSLPRRLPAVLRFTVLFLLASPMGVLAQRANTPALARPNGGTAPVLYVLEATPLAGAEIRLDGRLDESVWANAAVGAEFAQFEPSEGAPASQRTEARVLYGQDALYVGFRAFDSAPDSIVGQLTRRDQHSYSDELGVIVDSYFDRRTAFHFSVNPVGVKKDLFRFDDVGEDGGWDAVWDVATSIDEGGWTAEFRIPYSQLRFRAAPEQTWGIQFMRRVARLQETSVWAPTGRSESAIVSKMGELRGLRGIESARRIEMAPYSLGRLERSPGDAGDPFYEPNALSGAVGADVKVGVGGSLTLDLTLNPDFGQVEADPGQVNLSAFETFQPERRPFFLEGSNLFNFPLSLGDGDGAVESLFYSRRVGRAPQGSAGGPGYVDRSDVSTILGAVKLSGKTPGGWSVGVLSALMSEESARIQPFDGGPRYDVAIEPLTVQSVARFSRDFRDGRSAIGVIGTAVNRDQGMADALLLRREAFTGGFDVRHRFNADRYELTGYLVGSRVSGSEEAIALTQRSSARYFQRPDADHVTYDPSRTSLAGASASLSLGKIAGGHWRWATGLQSRSPGFEPSDAGFLLESDFTIGFAYLGYDQSTPQGPFRRWRLNLNAWGNSSWGRENFNNGGNVNANFQLANFWGGYAGVNYNGEALATGLLRGGPAFRREPDLNGWAGLNSDGRRSVQLNMNFNWNVRPESDSWGFFVGPNVSWRPSGRTTLSLGSSFNRNVDDRQWIRRVDAGGPVYLMGRLNQTTFGLTGRVDHAFTPTVSLQVYAQPFVSAGSYSAFKRVTDSRADEYADRFELLQAASGDDGRYHVAPAVGREGFSFRSPDFDFRQFRSNTVLRWEYRPGSALFLVWAQGRTFAGGDGDFDVGGNLRGLFNEPAENVLMLKLSYWVSP